MPLLAWKHLFLSHTSLFVAGVFVGTRIHADELEGYRAVYKSSNNSSRWLIRAALALGGATVLYLGLRIKFQQYQSKHTIVFERET